MCFLTEECENHVSVLSPHGARRWCVLAVRSSLLCPGDSVGKEFWHKGEMSPNRYFALGQ